MQAILMTATGATDVLQYQDVDEPQITHPGEVKVKLHAAGVNPVDTKLRRGGLFYENALPAILGCDGAGEVVAIGEAVSQYKSGDQVWFCHGGLGKEQGNYAEYNCIDERWLAPMPKTTSFIEAAAAPLVLITAWGGLYSRGSLKDGQTVLIHAGAGGVGHVAIQLAKIKGARVITTVSSEEKADFVKTLGADEVILYTQENFVEKTNQLTDGKGADLVFDTVGPKVFQASIEATAHFGSLVTLLDPGEISLAEARMRNHKIGFELMLTPMLRELDAERQKHIELLTQCTEWIEQGKLKISVAETLPLVEAAKAHQLVEGGHMMGKVVLEI